MVIYLKNGAVIQTADSLEKVRRENVSGRIVGMNWTHKKGESLYYIDLTEVIAVIDDFEPESGTTPLAGGQERAESTSEEIPSK
jgi:hypothetical protein